MKYPQVVSMPSAVSNWLDEQLEARGIDAVVYTRYILSLLHSHTVDVLYPEEDFQFSHSKKEVRRSIRGYTGSHRSSSEWWRHAHADAERIKRSAAVECLLSASEQNCEVESLVDELCEKLKEVNSESDFPNFNLPSEELTEASETKESKKITPQELAEKYYAAFPPLRPQSPTESKLLSLIPKWRNVTTSSSTTSPVKKKAAKKINKQSNYFGNRSIKENNDMKARPQKSRLNCLTRTAKNNFRNNSALNNWDFSFFTTNNKRLTSLKQKEEQADMQQSIDQCVDNKNIWNNEDEMNMYDDLPVDIKDLLNSPTPHDDTVEMMNIANMRDTGKRRFIPYGTNIMSSIWSTDQDITYDNNFNSAVDTSNNNSNDLALDFKFGAISIDNPTVNFDDWPPANSSAENETNALFENNKKCRRRLFGDFHSLPWNNVETDGAEKAEEKECFENEKLLNDLAFSLMKLNHNKEKSCFTEITPRPISQPKTFNPFGNSNNALNFGSQFPFCDNSDNQEDLLTSELSHFKPICESREKEVPRQSKYVDGSTFIICNKLDKVDFKRSESGTMLLENEMGQSKKYYEYKQGENTPSPDPELLILKFSVCQNDKACQTEEFNWDFDDVDNIKYNDVSKIIEPPKHKNEEPQQHCTCLDDNNTSALNMENSLTCPLHASVTRPGSMLSEVVWKEKACEKCDRNDSWNGTDWSTKGQMDSDWDENGLRSIWSGGEVCHKCLTQNDSKLTRPAPNHQLREDISQDGEQLLSDLSTIQKCYMDYLPFATERSLDISELISCSSSSQGVSKERKRRHSLIVDSNLDTWSFASRLEEDCLMQMATLPALRAVTL